MDRYITRLTQIAVLLVLVVCMIGCANKGPSYPVAYGQCCDSAVYDALVYSQHAPTMIFTGPYNGAGGEPHAQAYARLVDKDSGLLEWKPLQHWYNEVFVGRSELKSITARYDVGTYVVRYSYLPRYKAE